MSSARQGSRCYLIARAERPGLTPEAIERTFASLEVSCMLLTQGRQSPIDLDCARPMIDAVHGHDVACFIENDVQAVLKLGADGLHIDADLETYHAARRALGPDRQIGVACGNSRHRAMVLAENGADYVAFGNGAELLRPSWETAELIEWWSQLFEVPCVAWRPSGVEEAHLYAERGADFVALDDELWLRDDDESGVDAGLGAIFSGAGGVLGK